MIDPGADRTRRAWPTSTRPTARPSGRSRTSPASPACCRSTAMAAIARWPRRARSRSPSAGRTCAAASTSWPPPAPAPIATEALERIKALYAVEADIRGREPTTRAERSARRRAGRSIEALEPWLRAKLATISQKSKLAEAIRYALSRWEGLTLLPRRRPHRDRQQHRRARHPAPRAQPQERPLRRLRRRRRALGRPRLADRDLQAQRRRSRRPTWPTSSPASSRAIPRAGSTSFCPGTSAFKRAISPGADACGRGGAIDELEPTLIWASCEKLTWGHVALVLAVLVGCSLLVLLVRLDRAPRRPRARRRAIGC